MLIPTFCFLEIGWQALSVVAQSSQVSHLILAQQAVGQFQGAVVPKIWYLLEKYKIGNKRAENLQEKGRIRKHQGKIEVKRGNK